MTGQPLRGTIPEPKRKGSVWPFQRCPAFTPRQNASPKQAECWYCRYADFHLTEPVALEAGICCWPEVQLE